MLWSPPTVFVLVVLLCSCSLGFLPRSLCLAGLFLGWGGRGWGRNRGKKKNEGREGGGHICSFMTNHMCFWVFVFTCFSWKGGWWRGWRAKKDMHMVLVCGVKFRIGLFVSCDELRGIRSCNHLHIWLLPRQWWGLSLNWDVCINLYTALCFHVHSYNVDRNKSY